MRLYYMVFRTEPPKGPISIAVLVFWFHCEAGAVAFAEGVIANKGTIGLTESYQPVYATRHTTLERVFIDGTPDMDYYVMQARMPNGELLDTIKKIKR